MRYGRGKLNMPHALASYAGISNFDVALVAHLAFETFSLELAAPALVTLGRSKDDLAEESVGLRLAAPVVERLSLGNLTVRPAAYFLWRSQMEGQSFYLVVSQSSSLELLFFLGDHCGLRVSDNLLRDALGHFLIVIDLH